MRRFLGVFVSLCFYSFQFIHTFSCGSFAIDASTAACSRRSAGTDIKQRFVVTASVLFCILPLLRGAHAEHERPFSDINRVSFGFVVLDACSAGAGENRYG